MQMNRAFLKRASAAADNLRAAKLDAKQALNMAIEEYGDDCTTAKFDMAWDQFGSKVLDCSREQFRNSLRKRLRRAKPADEASCEASYEAGAAGPGKVRLDRG